MLNHLECGLCVFGSLKKVNKIRWNSRLYRCFFTCLHISFFHSSPPPGLCLAYFYFACALRFSSNTSKLLVSHCHPKTTNIWGWNRTTAKGNTYTAGFGAVLLNYKSINITVFVNVDGESLRNVNVLFLENTFQNYLQINESFIKKICWKSVETINTM